MAVGQDLIMLNVRLETPGEVLVEHCFTASMDFLRVSEYLFLTVYGRITVIEVVFNV